MEPFSKLQLGYDFIFTNNAHFLKFRLGLNLSLKLIKAYLE